MILGPVPKLVHSVLLVSSVLLLVVNNSYCAASYVIRKVVQRSAFYHSIAVVVGDNYFEIFYSLDFQICWEKEKY